MSHKQLLVFLLASQIKVRDSRLTVVGEKGYCMIRGTHGKSGLDNHTVLVSI